MFLKNGQLGQTVIAINKSAYGNKQPCKSLENFHLKRRRSCVLKLMGQAVTDIWQNTQVHILYQAFQ